MNSNSFFNDVMLSYNQSESGRELYSSFYDVVHSGYPDYLDEIRGMADGVGLPFSEVKKLLHFRFLLIIRKITG